MMKLLARIYNPLHNTYRHHAFQIYMETIIPLPDTHFIPTPYYEIIYGIMESASASEKHKRDLFEYIQPVIVKHSIIFTSHFCGITSINMCTIRWCNKWYDKQYFVYESISAYMMHNIQTTDPIHMICDDTSYDINDIPKHDVSLIADVKIEMKTI